MFNLRFAKDYLLYRLKAKTRHGTHSPFVYRLVDKVIYDFSAKKVYPEVEKIREGLLTDDRMITITDLGAGSHVNNDRQKKITSPQKFQICANQDPLNKTPTSCSCSRVRATPTKNSM